MTTLSIPIPADMEEFIENQIKIGNGSNKADIVRKAILAFKEQQAIKDVLEAMREPTLRGNLKNLSKKFKRE